MGVASLVLGIISLVLALFVSGFGWVASILALIGVILGALGRKKLKAAGEKTGVATAGLVLSIIGLVLGVVMYIACAVLVAGVGTVLEEAVESGALTY